MKFLKKNIRIIFFIIFAFIEIFILNTMNYGWDATWEYGMSHAFRIGEIPYVDFNIISTPLFIFLFSIGLFIYDSFITFLIEFFLLNILVFYYVNKTYQEKSLFYIFGICITFFTSLVPNYNFLCFHLLIQLF